MTSRVSVPLAWCAIILTTFFSRFKVNSAGISDRWPIDLEVYYTAGKVLLTGGGLYDQTIADLGNGLPFTYPPFAAMVFATFAWLPIHVVIVLYHVASIACAIFIARWLGKPLLAAALLLLTEPGFATLNFGQVNIFLLLLVLADVLDKRPQWLPRGVLIGLAAAIKVTPGIFLLFFLVRKDVRGLLGMIAGGAGATVLAAILRPHDSWTYFTDALLKSSRVGDPAYIFNASAQGVLLRLHAPEWVWAVLVLVFLGLGIAVAWVASRRGETALAAAAIAGIGLLISPISWTHHWVWLPIFALLTGSALEFRVLRWWTIGLLTVGTIVFAENPILIAMYPLTLLAYFLAVLAPTDRRGASLTPITQD